MAPSKTKQRRKKVREQRAETTASWWQRFRGSVGLWPVFVALMFVVAAIGVSLYGKQSLRYSVGQKIHQPILARVGFEQVNEDLTERNRQDARAAAPDYYRTNHRLINEIGLAIQTLYQDAKAAETFEAFAAAAEPKGWKADEVLFGELHRHVDEEGSRAFARWVEQLRRLLARRYTYRPADSGDRRPKATGRTVMVLAGEPQQAKDEGLEPLELDVLTARLYPISNPEVIGRLVAPELAREAGFPGPVLQDVVRGMLADRLASEPLLIYDKDRTEEAMQEAAQVVQPVVITFAKGQPIVSPAQSGGDLVLTEEHMARLRTEQRRYEALLHSDDEAAKPLRGQVYFEQAGTAAVVVVLALGLFVHVGLYEPRVLQIPMRTVALALLVLGMLWAGRVLDGRFANRELTLLPVLIAAACLAIAYPRRFAVGSMSIAALLMVVTLRADIGLFITLVVGLTMTVYLLADIRTRTQIMSAGLLTAVGVSLTAFAFGLIDRQALSYAARGGAWAAGSAVAAALVVQGILPFIERAFRMATSLTLVEWSFADKPLLQRLAREAPGTYNHSLVLGTIGEPACEAIGANGLLVRVGALYHDVGKIHKADYLAENQQASISRHDNLAASMSLLIILGHVKDGIELAREYGLPRVLHRFIEEHHGTTVVRYFHHKASEKQPSIASGKHDREVSEAEFRYPGPKPRSKETAVLMVCDGVEGAVRALSEPTAARIEGVVHQVIMERLNDEQFGECDITLKELRTVEDSLVKSLCTFYHGRVSYPKSSPAREAPRKDDKNRKDAAASDELVTAARSPGGQTPEEQRRPA